MLVRSFVPDGVRGVVAGGDTIRVSQVKQGVAVITRNGKRFCHGRSGDRFETIMRNGAIVQIFIDMVRADRVRLGFSVFNKDGKELTGNTAIRNLPVVPENF